MSRVRVLSVTLADCDLQTFTAGGPGGQHQNRSQTGVRIIHRASGARGEARDERSQLQNKKLAWRRMAQSKEMQLWLRLTLGHQAAAVAEAARMPDPRPEDIKIEVKRSGRWTHVQDADLSA